MNPRRALWLSSLLWLLLAATLVSWGVQQVLAVRADAQRELDTLEPRFARLAGLRADQPRLQQAVQQAQQAVLRHAYPGDRDLSQTGNDAQQRARELFAKAGLEVLSSQVMPGRVSGPFDRVPIGLRVEGELAALQAAFAALPALEPSLFVQGFSLQSTAVQPDAYPIRVVVELQLVALRVRT